LRKIIFLIASNLLVFALNAQFSLTKAFNEPFIGDINRNADFDSLSTMPNTNGENQLWDFSTLVSKSVVSNSTYTNVSSTPKGENYPTATMANYNGANTYSYYKVTPTQLEIVGLDDPNITLNYTNTAIAVVWPISYGYKTTDVFAGNAVSGTMTDGVSSGTITTWATGSGSLILPGGLQLDEVLQLRTSIRTTAKFVFGLVTATLNAIQYDYYHASEKFPVISITYSNINGAVTNKFTTIKLNNNVMMVSLPEEHLANNLFELYPNPAKDIFNLKFKNVSNSSIKLEVINMMGTIVKSMDLENGSTNNEPISIAGIAPGLYLIRISIRNEMLVKKLVVE
jgi:hypothetical protein